MRILFTYIPRYFQVSLLFFFFLVIEDKIEAVDRVSGLSELILHRKWSFLSREEAARTSVLSKQWNYIWDSFLILEFYKDRHIKEDKESDLTLDYTEKACKFMINFVDKSLQRFVKNNFKI